MAVLLSAPVVAGLAAGYLTDGRLGRVAEQLLRGLWLLYAAAVVQLLSHAPPVAQLLSPTAQRWLTAGVFAAVGVALLVNIPGLSWLARCGVGVVFAGGALNAAAILPNGHMPVAPAALRDDGVKAIGALDPHHAVETSATRLRWLGDIVPVPWLHTVVSVGDIVLMLGIALLVAALMHRSGPVRPAGPAGRDPRARTA